MRTPRAVCVSMKFLADSLIPSKSDTSYTTSIQSILSFYQVYVARRQPSANGGWRSLFQKICRYKYGTTSTKDGQDLV